MPLARSGDCLEGGNELEMGRSSSRSRSKETGNNCNDEDVRIHDSHKICSQKQKQVSSSCMQDDSSLDDLIQANPKTCIFFF